MSYSTFFVHIIYIILNDQLKSRHLSFLCEAIVISTESPFTKPTQTQTAIVLVCNKDNLSV